MIVDQIVASVDNPASGPTYSVTSLAAAIARRGARCLTQTVAMDGGGGREFELHGSRCRSHALSRAPGARLVVASPELRRALDMRAGEADILHTHGLWLMPNIYPSQAARRPGARAKVVLSPRGMLGEQALQFSRWKKRLFWAALQGEAVRSAACLHATAESEYAEIRAFGLRNPVAVVPNGIDVPAEGSRPDPTRTVLSLGRLHPKKGLETLLRAWARVEPLRPDWRLRIAGPSEGSYGPKLERLKAELGLRAATIEGPLYGADKAEALRAAELFVLPTLNENFGLVVAEALASGTPVISTKGAPWAGLESESCGWWIDQGVDPLAETLGRALDLPARERGRMGERGRDWMRRDFSWDKIAADMLDVYYWVVAGGSPPSTVRID